MDFSQHDIGAVILQYPDTDGSVYEFSDLVTAAHNNGVGFFFVYLKYGIFTQIFV